MRALALLALLGLAGCGTEERVPTRLSRTGRFGGHGVPASEVRPFTPRFPLWTDGADKGRWAYLPKGTRIEARDGRAWDFPVGTRFWKDIGSPERRVETRLLWKAAPDRWVFAAYAWRDDQRDADLVGDRGQSTAFEVAPGLRHRIPSLTDCRSCHDVGRVQVLGFSPLQLAGPQLEALAREGFLPAAAPLPFATASPVEQVALGWLHGNCGGCHQDRGTWAGLGLHLHSPEAVRATAVGVPGHFRRPGVEPARQRRVAPGQPEASTLLYRLSTRGGLEQMPPTGSVRVDEAGRAAVEAWIRSLH